MTPELSSLLTLARGLQPDKTRFTPAEMLKVFDHLAEVERLAEARLDLLREHHGYYRTPEGHVLPGKVEPCENPGRYQEDCGECLRCRSVYTMGALR